MAMMFSDIALFSFLCPVSLGLSQNSDYHGTQPAEGCIDGNVAEFASSAKRSNVPQTG